jgi:hypothetical protein
MLVSFVLNVGVRVRAGGESQAMWEGYVRRNVKGRKLARRRWLGMSR